MTKLININEQDTNTKIERSIILSEWMRKIPNSWTLAQMSIPGTHDSGTFELKDPIKVTWAKTQTHKFYQQMNMGVRFFDIRGRVTDDNTIVLHHGSIYLYVTLHQFIDEAKNFLNNNPSETIIMSLKEEYKAMPGAKDTFVDTFEKRYFNQSIFLKKEGNITMGDARGKIVLLRRYTGGKVTGGYRDFWWADNKTFNSTTNENIKITVQDQYNVKEKQKKDAIKNMLIATADNDLDPNHIHINFTSLSSGGTKWSSPFYFASRLNSWTAELVKESGKKAGWVIMDYVGDDWNPKLYWDVIDANFNRLNRYKIKTALNNTSGVDVSSAGDKNVHLYQDNTITRSHWKFQYNKNKDAYQIINVWFKDEVMAWNDYNGSKNVFVTKNQYKDEHYWRLEEVGNGYYIIKNYKDPNLVLDVQDGKTSNHTNIQVYQRNGTNAQKFKLVQVDVNLAISYQQQNS